MYSMQKYIILHNSTYMYKVQSFYIIRKGKIDEGTKPFCFNEWYGIHVCVPQSLYKLRITWRLQKMVEANIKLGNTVKGFPVRKREKLCTRVRPFKIDLERKWH